MVDDYEILPYEELEYLRHEVERLKDSPFPDSKQNKTLLESMDTLTHSINKLIKIFEGAQEDLINEYTESSPTKLLKQISEQNAKIAEGIVALAGIVKKDEGEIKQSSKPADKPAQKADPKIPPLNGSEPKAEFHPDTRVDLNSPDLDLKKDKRKNLFNSFSK